MTEIREFSKAQSPLESGMAWEPEQRESEVQRGIFSSDRGRKGWGGQKQFGENKRGSLLLMSSICSRHRNFYPGAHRALDSLWVELRESMELDEGGGGIIFLFSLFGFNINYLFNKNIMLAIFWSHCSLSFKVL